MKRSEVVKLLLDAYYFKEGGHTNSKVVLKANKIIQDFEKLESKASKEGAKHG